MTRVSASDVREGLRRAERGRRVVVRRRGKDVAAIIPLQDLERLEDLEDIEAARAAREEMERTGEKSIPWEKLKRDLGL